MIRCNTEIRFYGLRRSGNHAIINWLIPMLGGVVCHINDAQLPLRFYKGPKPLRRFAGDPSSTIISYENVDLTKDTNQFDVRSEERRFIMLLRDPYNLAASLLQNQYALEVSNFRVPMYNIKKEWKQYAREFLSHTNYLPTNTVKINFTKWFTDEDYRILIATELGLEYDDVGLNKVSGYGGGSSFDSTKLDGEAQKMDLLNRWKHIEGEGIHERFAKLIDDSELAELSYEIFGPIMEEEKDENNCCFS